MNIMVALPGEQYFAIPRSELEKYAVPKDAFDKELAEKERTGESVFSPEVEGQEQRPPVRSVPFGVRG